MSDEREQDADAAVIAKFRERLQRYKAENEGRSWTTTYYIPDVAYRNVAHAALREIDRLTIDLHFRNSQLDDERNENSILRTSRNTVIERWGAMIDAVPDHMRGQTPADVMLALIAERDAARAELAKLRAACKDVPDMLEYSLDYLARNETVRSFRRAAAAIRAALGIESEAGE